MHDLMFAGKIIDLLKEKIGQGPAPKQVTVNIILGPFTHVTEKSLRVSFGMLSKQEGFKNVCLRIKKNKAVIKCRKCKVSTEIVKPAVKCPKCGRGALEIGNTEEFVIGSIEII